ncbi:hypothetical protein GF325_09335 [Candidatus Bathyarchaeota archaeon]|nr:hypothetical protein [Candidatus Bathyarchaeota archaeon]
MEEKPSRLDAREKTVTISNGSIKVEVKLEPFSYSIIDDLDGKLVISGARTAYAFSVIRAGKMIESQEIYSDQFTCRGHESCESLVPWESGAITKRFLLDHPRLGFEAWISFDIPAQGSRIIIKTGIINNREYPVNIDHVSPLMLSDDNASTFFDGNFNDLMVYYNGYQSWSMCRVFSLSEKQFHAPFKIAQYPHHYNRKRFFKWLRRPRGHVSSNGVTVITNPKTLQSMTIGFVNHSSSHGELRVRASRSRQRVELLEARSWQDGRVLKPAQASSSMELFIQEKNNYPRCLDEYSVYVNKFMKAELWKNVPFGYCTWYYYYSKINEKEFLKNLEIAVDEDKNPFFTLDYFQLDDGFQPSKGQCGDWRRTDDEKFPRGLKPVVDAITSKGLNPGLWIAPFNAAPFSDLAKAHPDWLLRDRKGKPIKGCFISGKFQYALDPTHPGVLAFLHDLVTYLVQEIGFTYIKIDFLFSAIVDGGVFHDDEVTRIEAYRNAMMEIREAAGKEVFILGCGAPLLESVGCVNGMRISADTLDKWTMLDGILSRLDIVVPGMKYALLNTITRSWMHKKLWINDPDCLIVREKGSKLTLHEIQTEITLMGLSGGQISISEDLERLDAGSMKRVALLHPIYPEPAFSPDMFVEQYPRLFMVGGSSPIHGLWKVVACVNWNKKPADYTLHLSDISCDPNHEYHCMDFWNQAYLGRVMGGDSLDLPDIEGHGCRLLRITRVALKEQPLLLGTTFHVIQGALEVDEFTFDPGEATLTIRLKKNGTHEGKVFFELPERFFIDDIIGNDFNVENMASQVISIGLQFTDQARVVLRLERA